MNSNLTFHFLPKYSESCWIICVCVKSIVQNVNVELQNKYICERGNESEVIFFDQIDGIRMARTKTPKYDAEARFVSPFSRVVGMKPRCNRLSS